MQKRMSTAVFYSLEIRTSFCPLSFAYGIREYGTVRRGFRAGPSNTSFTSIEDTHMYGAAVNRDFDIRGARASVYVCVWGEEEIRESVGE